MFIPSITESFNPSTTPSSLLSHFQARCLWTFSMINFRPLAKILLSYYFSVIWLLTLKILSHQYCLKQQRGREKHEYLIMQPLAFLCLKKSLVHNCCEMKENGSSSSSFPSCSQGKGKLFTRSDGKTFYFRWICENVQIPPLRFINSL